MHLQFEMSSSLSNTFRLALFESVLIDLQWLEAAKYVDLKGVFIPTCHGW